MDELDHQDRDLRTVELTPCELALLLADLVRSAKEIRSRALLEELDALCSALEYALANHRKIRLR